MLKVDEDNFFFFFCSMFFSIAKEKMKGRNVKTFGGRFVSVSICFSTVVSNWCRGQ